MGKSSSKASRENRSNQMNPNNTAYHESRASTKAATDNRSNQLNPNNPAYCESRNSKELPEESKDVNTGVAPPVAWVDYGPDPPPPHPPRPHEGKCSRCGAGVTVHSGSWRCAECGTWCDEDYD